MLEKAVAIQADLFNRFTQISKFAPFISQSRQTAHEVEQHTARRHLVCTGIKDRRIAMLVHLLQFAYDGSLSKCHRQTLKYNGVEVDDNLISYFIFSWYSGQHFLVRVHTDIRYFYAHA